MKDNNSVISFSKFVLMDILRFLKKEDVDVPTE